jgi:protein-S-isoprenylcysteine O-methyltransferase Ste14
MVDLNFLLENTMDTESIYHWIAVVSLVAAMSISITYRSKANRAKDRIDVLQEGRLILTLRRIFGLALWLSALAYLINPAWMAWAQISLPAWVRWVGAVVMIACVPFIYWLFSSLGNNVTPTVAIRKEHTLVTRGPYRWIRHPLYTFGFLAFVGLSLLSANWFIAAAVLFGLAVILARTRIEEQRLVDRFGDDYRAYMQRTGRYFPRLRPGGPPAASEEAPQGSV